MSTFNKDILMSWNSFQCVTNFMFRNRKSIPMAQCQNYKTKGGNPLLAKALKKRINQRMDLI